MLFSRSHGLDNVHDLRADALLGLVGGSADVGRAGHHGMAVQRLVGGGLVGVHIQTGGANLAALQTGEQGGLVNVGAAGAWTEMKSAFASSSSIST